MASLTTLPSPEICDRARAAKDARFDGLFFTAVRSTGIYCRPVCPAPTPKRQNITYFPTAAAAAAAGFRPCLRCRPELSPGTKLHGGEDTVQRALALIADGALQDASIEALAAQVAVGSRQLRRLFLAHTGATPIAVHTTRRLLAREAVVDRDGLAGDPGCTGRRLPEPASLQCRVPGRLRHGAGRDPPPADRSAARHADAATRLSAAAGLSGHARVHGQARDPRHRAGRRRRLRARHRPGGCVAMDPRHRRRRPARASAGDLRWRSARDHRHCSPRATPVRPGRGPRRRARGLRVDARCWPRARSDVRACACPVAGTVSRWRCAPCSASRSALRGATTLARRLVEAHGSQRGTARPGLDRMFPTPAALADAPLEAIGLPRSRAATLRSLAAAVLDGRIDFRAGQRLDEFVERFVALPGIGPWTAHYVAMRALGHPDAFPAGDLVLQQVLGAPRG